jgi:uncharacterized protein (TIGR02246 family)
MRTRSAALAVVTAAISAVFAAACAHHGDLFDHAGPDRLEARQAEYFAAMADRDADRVAGLFAPDGVVHVANMPPVQGQAAIRQFYRNMFGFLTASTLTPEVTRVAAGGDMAFGTGSTSNEFRGPDGAVTYSGKYVLVWQRLEGDWRIAVYSISGNEQTPVR